MSVPITLVVTVLAGLLLVEIQRWAPWLAKKIIDRAVRRYEEPKRAEEREAGHANIDYCKTPLSQLSYAIYTYAKAPFRAREHRPTRASAGGFSGPSFGAAMVPQSVVLVASLTGLAVVGGVTFAVLAGLTVAVLGGGLDALYRRRRTAPRASTAREIRDRSVRFQLVAIGASAGVLLVANHAEALPVFGVSAIVEALMVCVAAGAATVYASSLMDWYCIVPAISGLVGDAPCESSDAPRWRRITRLWFLHRALAASTVAGATLAVPILAATSAGSFAAESLWSLTAAAVAVGGLVLNRGFATAFRYALYSPVSVGDVVRVRGEDERDAYVVDVSMNSIKYRFLDDSDCTAHSVAKDRVLPIREAAATRRVQTTAPCRLAGHCRAVNPYCHNNPNAQPPAAPEKQ